MSTPILLLPTAYLAPVQKYAHLLAATEWVEDWGERYIKQTYRNRCYIATPTGPQALTLPVARSGATHCPTGELQLSDHGNWQHQHWNALVSAYENSPFFEYYADDFLEIYNQRFLTLTNLNDAFDRLICSLLSIELPKRVSRTYVEATAEHIDLRPAFSPKAAAEADPQFCPVPYYQVFSERTGFLPNLSIVDLLFNMGTESRLVLRDSLRRATQG